MFDSTIKTYATRVVASLALALPIVLGLAIADHPEARQDTARGHATLTGKADAVDGDTLLVGGIRVRLEGIDAPETDQTCTDGQGRAWACGKEATRVLAGLVANRLVHCEERGLDKYKRLLGVCHVDGGADINAEMIRRGLAWAFVRYSQSYVADEAVARAARVGIWSGEALPAWDYRHGSWQTAEVAAPAGCPIKGNVTSHGRIYHMPWSPWYRSIKMDEAKGKRWFCSEDEALTAGWRPAQAR